MEPGQEQLSQDDPVDNLVRKIAEHYGVDFKDYAHASFRRRINATLAAEKLHSIQALQEKILADPLAFQRFVHNVTVSVTSMFRDPSFYLTLRQHVVPMLATHPYIRIWHAGCSTGEEVYSTAVLLFEEGLYDRVRIYATDVDALAIESAKQGIFPLASMKDYSQSYLKSGGKHSLSKYYTADHEYAQFRNYLTENIVFAQHNLVTDKSFNEFHMIMCRNVLIYFNDSLRGRVLSLLHDSLINFGYLALGSKESLRFSDIRSCYQQIVEAEKIYKRVI